MLLILLTYLPAILGNSLLGLFVLQNNSKSSINRIFALLNFAVVIWLIALLVADTRLVYSEALFFVRLATLLGNLMPVAFLLFSIVFPDRSSYLDRRGGLLILPLLPFILAAFTPAMIETVALTPTGARIEEFGLLYSLQTLMFLIFFGVSFLILLSKKRRLGPIGRSQINLLILGTVIVILANILSGFLANLTSVNLPLLPVGVFSLVVFSGFTAYSIIKHRLFDIRVIVARSVAYILTILTIGLIYGFGLFGFIDGFFPTTQTTTIQQAIYAFAAVFLAFTFQPLKRFFDHLTDRLFYRDRYDSEAVLNALGKVYVSKVNSFELLDDSLEVLVNALRVGFGHLLILDKGKIYRQAHYGGHKNLRLEAKAFRAFDSQVTIYDELGEDDVRRRELQEVGAQAVIKLATQEGLIGYLVLGAKQSGVIYTQQDVNLLELVARELAVAIQNAKSYAKIQAFSETLKIEVREATAQLRDTNKRLRKLDAAKDEFISMASHQLRTPLTSIKGYVSMLQDGDAGAVPKEQCEYLDLAFASAEKMNNLIADMLNVSRISTGKLTFDKAPVDLAKLVESEIDQLRGVAEAKGVQLDFRPPHNQLPALNLDGGKIRQVVMNFIDNAIYYTPKGHVAVSLEQIDGDVEFKVRDNGIGVSREAQKQLFSKFFRAGNAQKVRPDGTGLGLYMAKQVIEAQDGQIMFSSVEGKGSTFGFRFRLEDN